MMEIASSPANIVVPCSSLPKELLEAPYILGLAIPIAVRAVAYNNMFSMTSFGARIDDAVNDGRGPYVFKISGQISHWIGSICPPVNEAPRFLQLYIYDTNNEVPNRLHFFENSEHRSLSSAVVATLSQILNSCNEYVRLFKNAADFFVTIDDSNYSVRLYNNVGDRRYEPPASGTLGGIVYAEDSNATKYDIVVFKKDGTPQRDGSCRHVFAAVERGPVISVDLVDAYTCIEQSRLDFINANQNKFRSEYVAGLYDALGRGDNNARDVGKRIFLPSSFTGGPRYMYKPYQDALAICREHGNPQYFITFTCNVKWPEISRHLMKIGGAQSQNRPDIIARVFRIKVQQFLRFLRSNRPFGDVAADLYTIEFQKRGLPHCHTLMWVTPTYKVCDAADVDRYVSAEIPDPSIDPELYKIVTDLMMHGPCGLARPSSPCMRDGRCSKSFPKTFEGSSRFDKDGYVHYRRRDSPYRALKKGIALDNRYAEWWFESNKRDSDGLDLTYVTYSSRYHWDKKAGIWIPRIQLRNPAIGRLAYVHPASRELFYLRLLLCHQRGCKSFDDICKVSDVVHTTYRSACEALGLLGDEKEWLTTFVESSSWATSSELRILFVHMLLFYV
ncbi:hypothetical protein CASFOL_009343 [Castilleja foliolosa]|uniref:Helitron helicase-like domain-containing protein n=1 Tax=Castilleja foliolosa TaxID=1961234 RepID=A0ABD3DY26_9LAMI